MDWPRAKNLLLAAFAILNIFLLIQYRQLSASHNYKTFQAFVVAQPAGSPGNGLQPDIRDDSSDFGEDEELDPPNEELDPDIGQEPESEAPAEKTAVSELEQLRSAGIDILPALLPEPAGPLRMLRVRLHSPRAGELARSLFGTSEALQLHRFPGGLRYRYYDEELTVFDLGYIRYERKRVGESNKAADLSQSLMKRRVEAFTVAQQFLKRLPPLPDDMILDEINMVDPFTDVVRYVQVYAGLPLFGALDGRPVGGYLQMTIRNKQVVVMEYNRLEVIQATGQPKELLKPTDALLQLARQIERPAYGISVQDMKLGYFSGVYREAESWEIVPAWRVRLKDGKAYYMNAFTGLLEKQNIR